MGFINWYYRNIYKVILKLEWFWSWDALNLKNFSCSQDQTAMLWKWNIEQNGVDCIYVCKGHERGIDSVAVSPNSKQFATGSWDTMLKIWSASK